jgi:hypothetical protein
MTPGNGTRRDLPPELPQTLNEFDEMLDLGRENRALVRFRMNAQEIAILRSGGESGSP